MPSIHQRIDSINAQLAAQKQLIGQLEAERSALPGQLSSLMEGERDRMLRERREWEDLREDVNVCYRRVKDALHVNNLAIPRSHGSGERPNLERLYEMTRDPAAVAQSPSRTDEVLRLCGRYLDYIDVHIRQIENSGSSRCDQHNRELDVRRQQIDRRIREAHASEDAILGGPEGTELAAALRRAQAESAVSVARLNRWPEAGACAPALFGYEGPKINADREKADLLKRTFGNMVSGNKLCLARNIQLEKGFVARVEYNVNDEDRVVAGIEAMLLSALLARPARGLRVITADGIHYGPTFLGRLEPLARVRKSGFLRVPASDDEMRAMLKSQHAHYSGLHTKLAGQTLEQYNIAHPDEALPPTVLLVAQDPNAFGFSMAGSELAFLAGNARSLGITVVELVRLDPRSQHQRAFQSTLTTGADIVVRQTDDGRFYVLHNDKKRRFMWGRVPDLPADFVSRACQLTAPQTFGSVYFDRPELSFTLPTRSVGKRRPITVPIGIDDDDKLFNCTFEGDNFAAYIMGAAGSGKSSLLHTIIGSLIMNYHPDEVELWLVDFNKTEFSEYAKLKPPHVRNLLLEESEQLMFDLIDELMARMERRESIFEANGWKSLSDVPPSVFMPAIFVIIDEFAQVSMQLLETRNSTALPDYTLKLESLLRLGRKFGIKFIFSSQSFLSGVRGLTETARNQIQLRLAMKNVRDEVEGTLGVDGSNRTDALMDEINSLGRFQSIFRQQEKVDGRDTWRYYHVRNLYLEYDALRKAVLDVNAALHAENASSADFAQALTSDNAYADKHPVFLTSDAPVPYGVMKERYRKFAGNVRAHAGYETVDLSRTALLNLGVPASFVQVKPAIMDLSGPEENVLVAGGTDDERACMAMSALRSWFEVDPNHEGIEVWGSRNARAYADHMDYWGKLTHASSPGEIKARVESLKDKVLADKRPRLVIVFGLDAIFDEMGEMEELAELSSLGGSAPKADEPAKSDGGGTDLWSLMQSLDEQIGDGPLDDATRASIQSQIDGYNAGVPAKSGAPIASGDVKRVKSIIGKLLEVGPKRGTHFIVLQPDAYSVKKCGLDQQLFMHKVAFPMSRGDSYDMFGGPVASNLAAGTAVYTCERRQVRIVMRPHIYKGMVVNGWRFDGTTTSRTGGA
ncbi:FtsK/SpoIIIE domain-containing protein [Slackia heliotrinireducens]|uniref:FtsK/SpoIIIE domain-containing protein n=1 Tax=Slackia heliotrinireducens TaxID=84110 RepID=UPI003314C7BE